MDRHCVGSLCAPITLASQWLATAIDDADCRTSGTGAFVRFIGRTPSLVLPVSSPLPPMRAPISVCAP